MSENFYLDSFVLFPEKENVFAIFPSVSRPFVRAEIGYSEPIEDYRIKRDGVQNYTVIEYVISGKGEVITANRKQEAKAGDVFVLVEGEPHCYRSYDDEPFTKIWVKYEADYTVPFLKAYGVESGVYHAENARPYFERLRSLPDTKMTATEAAFTVADCINKIIYLAASSVNPGAESDETKIREALNAAIYEKIDLDVLAERLHISKSNIIRKFKKKYAVTPYEYLLALKIENAKTMLKSTNMTVKEIAERLSVTDDHYFSSLFSRRTGMRPLEYRKMYKDI